MDSKVFQNIHKNENNDYDDDFVPPIPPKNSKNKLRDSNSNKENNP